ncbi:hypothetical protein PIB30_057215 [Stylosanthes scabra]|uniref:Putative plant transposon protein domain-containing protein n=1 Tax=Stylosanthes scabra TaxID=79078 RepID=A0ABU6XL66_9FABA|nr:hypothetical protein [Stylosanthes scabra]
MASSSSTVNMLDEHCFRTMFNQNLFEELVCRKKVTPEVTFDLEDDEYPTIKEQIALRGWRRLASPRTKINKLLIQEFYANALKRAELTPLARGWQDFIIHSIIPTGNKSEITIAKAILIHSIIKGEDVRAEELIADNIAAIAQRMQGKGKLAFPSTIFKLCKDAQVPMREFKRTELIPQDKLITTRLMETTRLGRNVQPQYQQPETGFQQSYWEQQQQGFHLINEQLAGMQVQQQQFFENMQSIQAQYLEELKTVKARQDELWNNTKKFHHQIRKEQDMLAREIQEVKKFQVNQTLMGNRKEPMEKLEQTMGFQQKEMTEIKKQLKEWTRHASSRDAYCCWAHQQANPNLTEIPIHQIPDLIQADAEKGRHIFHGALKSQLVVGSSSQAPPPQPADEPMADPRN